MKLRNNVSMPTRTVSPNLRTPQRKAVNNPSFGATLKFDKKCRNQLDSYGETYKREYFAKLLRFTNDLKKIYKGYQVKITQNDTKIDRFIDGLTYKSYPTTIDIFDENTQDIISHNTVKSINDYIITNLENLIPTINSCLESAFLEQNSVSDCKTFAEMKEKYVQGLERANEMNVPANDLNEYKFNSVYQICKNMKQEILDCKTSKDMKKELENRLELAKEIGLSDEQIGQYRKEANKAILARVEEEKV